ncbi:50S ribosomal protein L44e [Candidatus Marsarchaeota archaeon]|nr:50S ribosomal protein L44e [Candidatus Marsarchaeota archaeon]MCL5404864.1 50S ribosomal protein L44e [Candidatus Marsarchaeota archaeon]
MKIARELNAYCPKCGKHTPHKVLIYSKKQESGLNLGKRRRARKLKGYIGKVKGQATVVKIAKRQKVLLQCDTCKYKVERVLGSRTKKKLEFAI